MPKVNIYLNFNGNCEEAFNFYHSVFGGEFSYIGRFGDMPPQEGMPPMSDEEKKRIMHVALPISNETCLMGSDTLAERPVVFGTNFNVSVTAESRERADYFFNSLSEGGEIIMPMQETFWGDYFGMFKDKFGIYWMISTQM